MIFHLCSTQGRRCIRYRNPRTPCHSAPLKKEFPRITSCRMEAVRIWTVRSRVKSANPVSPQSSIYPESLQLTDGRVYVVERVASRSCVCAFRSGKPVVVLVPVSAESRLRARRCSRHRSRSISFRPPMDLRRDIASFITWERMA